MAKDTGQKKEEDKPPVVSPNYKGPGKNFPFRSFRTFGIIHIALGLAAIFLAIVQLSIGPRHRDIFLQFAAAPLWCPIPVIAVGILGVCMSRKRYWEVRCMKVCFGLLSLLNAFLFMLVLGSLVGFYGFFYYSISDYEPVEVDEELVMEEDTGTTVLIMLIIAIAGAEVLFSILSFFICCCCSPVKRPSEAKKALGPTPDHFHTPSKPAPAPQQAASPPSAPPTSANAAPLSAMPASSPVQYAVPLPPGTVFPGGAVYPPGTVFPPGSLPPGTIIPGAVGAGVASGATGARVVGAAGAAGASPSPTANNVDKNKKNKKKDKPKKEKKGKKNDKKKNDAPPVPEKADPEFPLQIPEYMRNNMTSPGGPYTSMPSLPSSAPSPQAPTAPSPFAPGYSQYASSPNYYSTIPNS